MAWLIALLGKWLGPAAAKLVAWLIVIALLVGSAAALYYSVYHDGFLAGAKSRPPEVDAAKTETQKEHALRTVAETSAKTLLAALQKQNKEIEGWQAKAKSAQARSAAALAALDKEIAAHNAEKARLLKRWKESLDAPDLPTAESCAEAARIYDELAKYQGSK